MRHNLDSAAQEVTPPLATDHRRIDLASSDVRQTRQVFVDEALVVTKVQIGLRPIVRDEYLAVLVRRHRARIDVDVRIELQDADRDAACLEQPTDRRDGDPLAN